MNHQPDYYEILGVDPEATTEEIEEAAAALAAKFPEEARDPSANAAFGQLVAAHETLVDSDKRAAYDRRRAQQNPGLLKVTIQSSRRHLQAMNVEQLLYLLVNLRAPADPKQHMLPLNLALVFDRSTSMREERLERVKAAARQVVEKLSPEDVISVVTFSDRAEVVAPAQHVQNRQRILPSIQSVQASGGTEIYQGLRVAVNELRRAPLPNYLNHLVLMTDGQTYGDEEKCLALARNAATNGITISAFGIGDDWNDHFLDRLVSPSGGHSVYIDRPDKIVTYLREQINGLDNTYARNLRLKTQLPAGIRCNYAIKLSPFSQPLDFSENSIRLGRLEARAPLSFLLELIVEPQRAGTQLSIPLVLLADIPGQQLQARRFKFRRSFEIVPHEVALTPPPTLVKAVEMLTLYRMSEQAWNDYEAGDTLMATRRMEHLTTRLEQAGHTKLARQASLETERLADAGTLSVGGRKKLKYGTRTLINTALMSERDDG